MAKIVFCTMLLIDQIHKSHNAPVLYPTVHHSEENVHIFVLNGALWDMGQVHLGFVRLVYWICSKY